MVRAVEGGLWRSGRGAGGYRDQGGQGLCIG